MYEPEVRPQGLGVGEGGEGEEKEELPDVSIPDPWGSTMSSLDSIREGLKKVGSGIDKKSTWTFGDLPFLFQKVRK